MKRCLTPLLVWVIENKTTVRCHFFKLRRQGDRRMAQQLRVQTAPAEDQSLVPSIHGRRLTAATCFGVGVGESGALWCPLLDATAPARVCAGNHTHRHIDVINNKSF